MLKKLRSRWRVWVKNRPHPWKRVKRWATSPEGSPRRVLARWRTVQRWAKAKKDNAVKAGVKDMWRLRFRVARKRARAKLEWLQEHADDNAPGPSSGLIYVDGKPVPSWMVPWVQKIRARGNWSGIVVSGYRTPAYSQQLCYGMCGAPSCPGTCAGVNSNHSQGYTYPQGAIDVSDYWTFAAEARAVHAPFKNSLPNDRVHFSFTGY